MLEELTLTLLVFVHFEWVELLRLECFKLIQKLTIWYRLFVTRVTLLIYYLQTMICLGSELDLWYQADRCCLVQYFERLPTNLCLQLASSFEQL